MSAHTDRDLDWLIENKGDITDRRRWANRVRARIAQLESAVAGIAPYCKVKRGMPEEAVVAIEEVLYGKV